MSQAGVGAGAGVSFVLGVPSATAFTELATSRAMAVNVVSLRMSISQFGVAGPAACESSG